MDEKSATPFLAQKMNRLLQHASTLKETSEYPDLEWPDDSSDENYDPDYDEEHHDEGEDSEFEEGGSFFVQERE